MNYFKKSGARTHEELGMLQAIETVIEQKQIPRNEIPECNTLDDLIEVKHLLDAYEVRDNGIAANEEQEQETSEENFDQIPMEEELSEQENIDQELETETEDTEQSESFEEMEQSDAIEPEVELAEIVGEQELDFEVSNYDPFADPIIERSYNQGQENEDVTDFEHSDIDPLGENLEEAKEPTPLDSPTGERTKRKAAEQTADTLIKGYARLAPKPFKWLAKVSESKVEKLAFSGQLDVSIEVSKGMTFDDYVRQTNEQVDEIFEVDEETLEEIREPLVDVLMEQELELTPQQRLGMAILSHLMQMFTVAMKLRTQNNRILNYQKELTRLSRTKAA